MPRRCVPLIVLLLMLVAGVACPAGPRGELSATGAGRAPRDGDAAAVFPWNAGVAQAPGVSEIAQPRPAQKEPRLAHRSPEELLPRAAGMSLEVTVLDGAGKPVSGLQERDFALFDNGQARPILSVVASRGEAKSEAGVEVILLIDEVNTSFQRVSFAKQEVKKFLSKDGGRLEEPISVALFSDAGVAMAHEPTRDGRTLAAELDRSATPVRMLGPATGANGAIERMMLSLRALTVMAAVQAKRPGRKVLIWIGPGWPMLAGPSFRFTQQQQQRFFESLVLVSDKLREARMTVDSIDPLDLSSGPGLAHLLYKEYLKGVRTVHEASSGSLAEQVFAIHSGGRVLDATGDVAGEIANCVTEARSYYILQFMPAKGQHPDEYHELAVRVARSGVSARTATAYYAQP